MKWYLFIIGIVWVMSGTLMLFATNVLRERWWKKLMTVDPRLWSPLALAAGVLFLVSSSCSSEPGFIVVLGILSLAKGLLLLFGPRDKIRKMTDWWLTASDKVHRPWGVAAVVLGIAVLGTLLR
jgi:hypothetical protein